MQLGLDIDGEAAVINQDSQVSLSSDGSRMAIEQLVMMAMDLRLAMFVYINGMV